MTRRNETWRTILPTSVWAAGPWLGRLFPGLVELRVARREYDYFAVGPEWSAASVPVFYEFAGPIYGFGSIDGRGGRSISSSI